MSNMKNNCYCNESYHRKCVGNCTYSRYIELYRDCKECGETFTVQTLEKNDGKRCKKCVLENNICIFCNENDKKLFKRGDIYSCSNCLHDKKICKYCEKKFNVLTLKKHEGSCKRCKNEEFFCDFCCRFKTRKNFMIMGEKYYCNLCYERHIEAFNCGNIFVKYIGVDIDYYKEILNKHVCDDISDIICKYLYCKNNCIKFKNGCCCCNDDREYSQMYKVKNGETYYRNHDYCENCKNKENIMFVGYNKCYVLNYPS